MWFKVVLSNFNVLTSSLESLLKCRLIQVWVELESLHFYCFDSNTTLEVAPKSSFDSYQLFL